MKTRNMARLIGTLTLFGASLGALPAAAGDGPQPPVGEATAATRAAQAEVRAALP